MRFTRDSEFLRLRSVIAALGACALVALLRVSGVLERAELFGYDVALQARPPATSTAPFLLIEETEEDLQRFGHPLSDATLAAIIDHLEAVGARVIGIDKFRDIPVPPGSSELHAAIAANANVYWIYAFGGNGMQRVAPPLQLAHSGRIGFNDMVADRGGVVRRGLLYLDDGGTPQASFSLVLALAYLAHEDISPAPDPTDPQLLRLGHSTIRPVERWDGGYANTDNGGYQLLLDFREAPAGFARKSLGALLDGQIAAELIRGRIVIFGSSATSLKDSFTAPVSRTTDAPMLGIELLAYLASQLIRTAHGAPAGVTIMPEWLEYLLLVVCCLAGLTAVRISSGLALAIFAATTTAVLGLVWYACAVATVWLPAVPLALGFWLATMAVAAERAFFEARARATLMTMFSRHVSPEVARELWTRRAEFLDHDALRPQQLTATILFADIRGYSTVAEKLDPLQTSVWLNKLLTLMADVIMQHNGVIRQYVGDAIMAVFGAPAPSLTPAAQAADAQHAVQCAVTIRQRLAALNVELARDRLPPAGFRIGIHTGAMVACSVGSVRRMEYALVGDAVNIAARLQALVLTDKAADYDEDCRILISADTYALLAGSVECRAVGPMPVKGRREAVGAFRVSGGEPVATHE